MDDVIRSINTGSGLSYIIPIIVICLGALISNEMSIIIIENPEIYLHPDAQIKLAEFLLFVSKHAQLIVETHSEHILKSIMDENSSDKKIIVFKLNDDNVTEKIELTQSSFKTTPISYTEVQYRAFDIITAEFHALLYTKIHDTFQKDQSITTSNKNQIKVFDGYLNSLTNPDGTQKIPKENFTCIINGKTHIDLTLPTYIRNSINHPVPGRQYQDIPIEKIKHSIDIMLAML